MPLSKFGVDVIWWIFGGLQNVPLKILAENIAAWRPQVLHSAVHLCTFTEATLPCSSLPGFSRRRRLSSFGWVPVGVFHSAFLPSFLEGRICVAAIPFQLPLAPFSLSNCSSFDKCLICQVLFLPYGMLCAQADRLSRGWNLENRIKDCACLVCTRLWADIPQHPTNQMKLSRAKDAVP